MLFGRRRWAIRILERTGDVNIRSPAASILIRMTIYGSKVYTRKLHRDSGLWMRLPESVLMTAISMPAERSAVEELAGALEITPEAASQFLDQWATAAAQLAVERGGDFGRMVSAELSRDQRFPIRPAQAT